MLFNIALNYGGRAEIVDAARRAIAAGIEPEELDEQRFASFLYTAGQPDPDLLIRTSGEMRVSNFLLWQIAYAEIWVTDTLWPDFRAAPSAARPCSRIRSAIAATAASNRSPRRDGAGDPYPERRRARCVAVGASVWLAPRRGCSSCWQRLVAVPVAICRAGALCGRSASRVRGCRGAALTLRSLARGHVGLARAGRSSRSWWRSCRRGRRAADRRSWRGARCVAATAATCCAPLYLGLPLGVLAAIRWTTAARPQSWSMLDGCRQRHLAVLRGPAVRPPVAGARHQPEEDDRRRRRRLHRRLAADGGAGRVVAAGRAGAGPRAARPGDRRPRHHRRPVRVDAEARRRRERQLEPDPGPRRRARPHRRAAVRGARFTWRSSSTGPGGRHEAARHPRFDRIDRPAARWPSCDAHPDTPGGGRACRGPTGRAIWPRRSPATARAIAALDERRGSAGAPRALHRKAPDHDMPARTGSSRSPRIPTSTSCSAPRRARQRSRRCSRRSRPARRIALANKEMLVMAGALVTKAARARGVPLLPVDSEHNAIHQCLHGRQPDEVTRADSHRVGRALSARGRPRSWNTPRPTMRCGIPHGGWAARSPSTRPR